MVVVVEQVRIAEVVEERRSASPPNKPNAAGAQGRVGLCAPRSWPVAEAVGTCL